jgi:hypothetical protein
VKRLDEDIRILQQFKVNEWYLVRKLNLKFMQINMNLYHIYRLFAHVRTRTQQIS